MCKLCAVNLTPKMLETSKQPYKQKNGHSANFTDTEQKFDIAAEYHTQQILQALNIVLFFPFNKTIKVITKRRVGTLIHLAKSYKITTRSHSASFNACSKQLSLHSHQNMFLH